MCPDTWEPISLRVLKGLSVIWGSLCTNQYEATLFNVSTLVAFCGALCISELVVSSLKEKSNHALL